MSKLDSIMEAFNIKEDVNDTSKKISDDVVEKNAENMASNVVDVTTEVTDKNDSDTTIISGDE